MQSGTTTVGVQNRANEGNMFLLKSDLVSIVSVLFQVISVTSSTFGGDFSIIIPLSYDKNGIIVFTVSLTLAAIVAAAPPTPLHHDKVQEAQSSYWSSNVHAQGTLFAARRAAAFVRGDDVIHKLFTELAYRYKFIDRENELRQSKPPAPQPAQRPPLDPWTRSQLSRSFAPPKEVKSSEAED
ncbi:Ribosomal protein L17 [Cynara cardunculus var. scolymus]|uniref:Ribosomal protein L17 n=1 Tax=Cynara cardunculus var. scolymus TaxID=59895 RepID=A0A103XY47_CYNCS|nr:Ribosomal protein L17 [Cynara cardunculus var. scolymus]